MKNLELTKEPIKGSDVQKKADSVWNIKGLEFFWLKRRHTNGINEKQESHSFMHAFFSFIQSINSNWIVAYAKGGFPCGSAGKESACNAGNLGLIPGLGRSPGEGKGYPLQYSGLENSMDWIVHAVPKSRIRLSDFHFHFHFMLRTMVNNGNANMNTIQSITQIVAI